MIHSDDSAARLAELAHELLPGRLSPVTNVFVTPSIPSRKLAGARRHFIDPQDGELVLVLHDDTVFGSGRSGFAVTDKALVFNLPRSATDPAKLKSAFPLALIKTIKFDSHYLGCDVVVNDQLLFNTTSLSRRDAAALQGFFDQVLAHSQLEPSSNP